MAEQSGEGRREVTNQVLAMLYFPRFEIRMTAPRASSPAPVQKRISAPREPEPRIRTGLAKSITPSEKPAIHAVAMNANPIAKQA